MSRDAQLLCGPASCVKLGLPLTSWPSIASTWRDVRPRWRPPAVALLNSVLCTCTLYSAPGGPEQQLQSEAPVSKGLPEELPCVVVEGGGKALAGGVPEQVCHWMVHSTTRLSPASRMRICTRAAVSTQALGWWHLPAGLNKEPAIGNARAL